ncbi:MAG: LutC/YkgG family protein, partial [Aeoliella sp.]
MSESRRHILEAVCTNRPAPAELPSLDGQWLTFADPLEQFCAVLSSIGAHAVVLRDPQAANDWLFAQANYAEMPNRISLVNRIGDSTFSLDDLSQPHELAQLDWAVLPGAFGVAENGAVWITDDTARHRAVYFLCEHLVLVLPAGQIVCNMHEAYKRLAGFGTEDAPPFGNFIAGPSKTADIEQSLVIGAQGPRSLAVLL